MANALWNYVVYRRDAGRWLPRMQGYGATDGTLHYWFCHQCGKIVEKEDYETHLLWHFMKEAP